MKRDCARPISPPIPSPPLCQWTQKKGVVGKPFFSPFSSSALPFKLVSTECEDRDWGPPQSQGNFREIVAWKRRRWKRRGKERGERSVRRRSAGAKKKSKGFVFFAVRTFLSRIFSKEKGVSSNPERFSINEKMLSPPPPLCHEFL